MLEIKYREICPSRQMPPPRENGVRWVIKRTALSLKLHREVNRRGRRKTRDRKSG